MIKCTVKEGPFSPSLIRVVDEITNMNPDDKVVQVIASELNGHNILYLTSSNTYNPDFVDGYFIYKGRLITYFQTDSINRRNLVNEKELLRFKDNIHGYINAYYSSVNSEPTQELFEVNKNNIIRVKDIRRFVDCDCKANKTTVFFNNNLEHTLHAYIKITLLSFTKFAFGSKVKSSSYFGVLCHITIETSMMGIYFGEII